VRRVAYACNDARGMFGASLSSPELVPVLPLSFGWMGPGWLGPCRVG
jgi:hypothetical protein